METSFDVSTTQLGYPGTLEDIVDPTEYTEELCSCKAIISTRFHGAILGLHMGVPTFGAFHLSSENKLPELMINLMSLPDQFFLINDDLTRDVVDREVDSVRRLYEGEGRRGATHARLTQFYEEFQAHAHQVLYYVISVEQEQQPWLSIEDVSLTQHPAANGTGVVQEAGLESAAGTSIASSEPAADRVGHTMSPRVIFLSPHRTNSTTIGESYVVMFLLFAIAGLAFLPSTANGSRNLRQRPSKDDDIDKVPSSTEMEAMHANIGQSRAHKNGETLSPSSTATSSRDSELGEPERSMDASLGASLQIPPRRHFASNDKSATIASTKCKLYDIVLMLNFALWIALAVMFTMYSKCYLQTTRDPTGLLILQGTAGAVVLFTLGRLGLGNSEISGSAAGLSSVPLQPESASPRATLAAVLHTGQALLANISLCGGGVAVTIMVKATEPVVAALLSYLLLGKNASPSSMVSFAIIVAGVFLIACKSDGGGSIKALSGAEQGGSVGGIGEGEYYSRNLVSAVLAMATVCFNALRNVLIKKSDPVPPHQTLFSCSLASGEIGVAIMLMRLLLILMDDIVQGRDASVDAAREYEYSNWLRMDGVIASLCFVGYNLASFNLLARLSPVGHAVGNTVKRVVVFGSGMLFLGEVMTSRQLTGTAVGLAGVTMYNVAQKRK